eukprot:2348718-Rhodomonas_salina.2
MPPCCSSQQSLNENGFQTQERQRSDMGGGETREVPADELPGSSKVEARIKRAGAKVAHFFGLIRGAGWPPRVLPVL